tara:strand:+ start:49 stop:432 length:384 start_codon:yes stop_codon:yes gene_type:complete
MNKPFLITDEESRLQVQQHIGRLNIEKAWNVSVKPYRRKRSLNQNALLHKWFDIIASDIGDSPASVKADLKAEFCPAIESKVTPGKMRPLDTSEMNTAQMAEFMNRIEAFAASELAVMLPVPEDMAA